MNKAKQLDQFFTKPDVVKACISKIPKIYKDNKYTWIEPACGEGAFYYQFPVKNKIAMDIDPKISEAIQQDFLQYTTNKKDIVVVTNPPFGSFSGLAVDFFKKAAEFADVICMLIPSSFESYRIQRRLPKEWVLESTHRVRENAFTHNGEDYPLRCVFQVWVKNSKKQNLRELIAPAKKTHKDFTLVADGGMNHKIRKTAHLENNYDIAFPWWDCRRAIKSHEEMQNKNVCTSYWLIKCNNKDKFLKKISTLDLMSAVSHGQSNAPALRWNDFVELYNGKEFKVI